MTPFASLPIYLGRIVVKESTRFQKKGEKNSRVSRDLVVDVNVHH